jgi:hypothetical protein
MPKTYQPMARRYQRDSRTNTKPTLESGAISQGPL